MTDQPPHPGGPYFAALAERLGEAYLRYDFTRHSAQEVGFLKELLGLSEGDRILDVGCGPGRHAVPLAEAGYEVTGVDVSRRFLDLAADAARAAGVRASFFEVDARQMPFDDEFDAVISICQGAFGLMGKDDSLVLRRMMESARRGAPVVVTAFNAYFVIANPPEDGSFDADSGIVFERARIKDPEGAEETMDAWTSVYTPRELRLLALGVGLVPEAIYSIEPGGYARRPPEVQRPELMLVARRPR